MNLFEENLLKRIVECKPFVMDKLPELKVVQSLAASLSKKPQFHSQEEIQKLEIGVTLKYARQFLKQYQEGLSQGFKNGYLKPWSK